MNDQNPAEAIADAVTKKPRFRNLLSKSDTTDQSVKTPTSVKEKVKTGLAVVGVVSLAAVIAGKVAKDRGVDGLQVDLPDVAVNPDS